jgi:hypothetical protein
MAKRRPGNRSMNIWHLVFRTDSLTYTVGRALQECGHELSVWVVDPEHGVRASTYNQSRIAETPGVHILGREPSRLPAVIDRLIVQMHPRPSEAARDVPLLAERARAITLISAGDRSRAWRDAMKLQWLEMRSLGGRLRLVDRVLYKDGFYRADLFRPLRRRQVVGFDVHSHFLHRKEQFDAMHGHDWDVPTERPILVNFLGSQDPAERKSVLDSVRHLFHAPDGGPRPVGTGKTMFWHEYSDARPAGLPPTEFVAMLTRSDFTLCPRGYSLVTHRPMEAMLRGSIPVLGDGELDLYGIELVDGHNCIAVAAGRWPEAIERIVALRQDQIRAMRANLLALRPALEYRQVARGICDRLGVTAEPARSPAASMALPAHSRR